MAYHLKYKGQEIDERLDLAGTALQEHQDISNLATKNEVAVGLNNKVDKVYGKGLSTEDFTTFLKTKLESLNNYNDTELSNAIKSLQTQFNTLVSGNPSETINSFNEIIAFLDGVKDTQDLGGIIAAIEQQIASVSANIPTKVSQLTNDKGYINEHQDISHLAPKKDVDEALEEMYAIIGSHNKEVRFFCIEPVTVKVGNKEYLFEANQVATVFVGDEEFEIIPTSNQSIKSLLGYPIPLTWYDWLEGVDVFGNIVFDMNNLDTYKHWIQYYQGEYHVQKAQYSNCIFWSDKPYTHSPFEERTNYTIYYSAELPMCYSTIPENTYKPFYLAYGVNTDPNWNNPDYVNSYSLVSGATQTFSYYGATAIGIFDMGVDIIKLPKDCRGLMYHAPAITHAGVFDAVNTTNFGAKKGSWQEAFGDCISLVSLYIKNLKKSINISWSPINNESIEFILNNAANTTKITISLSPYTWYRLTDSIRELAKSKNITLELISTNYPDDVRWESKQDTISDLDEIRSGAAKGATALQPDDIPNSAEPMVCAYRIASYTANHIELDNYTYNGQTMDYREGAIILITNPLREDVVFEGGTLTLDGNEYETDAFTLKVGATILFSLGVDPGMLYEISSIGGATTTYVDQAIANAITNTLNTPV